MKLAPFAFAALCLACYGQEPRLTPHTSQEHPILPIGSQAPDFSLPGIDGKTHTLSEYKAPILAVMFICNHCPTSQLYEGRMKKLVEDYSGKGVDFVAINPNDPKAVMLSELGYTDVSDSLDEMKIRAGYRHFNFPYLWDGATQSVTQAYGAQATPHVFLFDKDRKLRYEGRIDNAQRESLVKIQDARLALDAMLAGKPVATPHTPSFGCSTKWKSKIDAGNAELKKIEAEPVTVAMATADDLRKLRQNPTDKVLLVNFWATWCGPCLEEMPAIEETWRMYRHRDFDLVTVAANYPDEKNGVLKVLQAQHASSRNLLFGTDDTYGLQAAFDAKWDAGVPYTMAIAPGGRVIYREQGSVDVLAMRRAILANLENETYVGHPAYWATGGGASLGMFEGDSDVGTGVQKGGVDAGEAGEYHVTGGGADMWGKADAFHFVWKKMPGDVALTADVQLTGASTQEKRKAALMIRQSLDAGSAYADVAFHGNGEVAAQWRLTAGDVTGDTVLPNFLDTGKPQRIRIERKGDVFVVSAGVPLTEVGRFTVKMPEPVYVGLAVCAHDAGGVTAATFSNVKVEGK